MPKATLNRIGGLTPFLDELADDHAIGRELRAAGIEVKIPRFAVGHVCFERNLRSLWQLPMRVAGRIRSIDPIGYVGTIFMHPMMLSLLAACFSAKHSVGLAIGALASRAFLSFSVEHSFGLPRQGPARL